uniref:Serine-threonine/tyrosine-protein kinase catalytic domain-containing protein n=2 Tax=Tetranychus urticae TaxID=32264 RepID=T1KSD9_TETUR
MWKCWQFRPEDRPTFAEICQTMTTYFLCSNI